MVPLGAMVLVKRVYFVLEDSRGIFFIHIPMTIAWVGTAYLGRALLDPAWWTVAVALGLTLSNLVGLALRAGGMRRRLGGLSGFGIVRVHVLAAIAAAVAAGVGVLLRVTVMPTVEEASSSPFLIGAAVCLIQGTVMGLVYAGVLKLTKVEEIDSAISTITRRLRRPVR
jgi:putative peptidoglycan lipid II flippase